MRHVTVFNPGMMLRFGGHVWADVHPPLTRGGWGDNAPVLVFDGHEPIVMIEEDDVDRQASEHGDR